MAPGFEMRKAVKQEAVAETRAAARKVEKLIGYENFRRCNPKSDLFRVEGFHHVEFWCQDALSAQSRFQFGLGMQLIKRSDQCSGNKLFCSYVLQSHDLVFAFTSAYPEFIARQHEGDTFGFDPTIWRQCVDQQGFGVRAVGVSVADAEEAFSKAVESGATAVSPPHTLEDPESGEYQIVAEVKLYGNAVLRFISGSYSGQYLAAGYEKVAHDGFATYGLRRLDHVVGNVPVLLDAVNYVMGLTGFHEFAEFTAEDVGTVDSGLNSLVLANNNETVLLPINEPTTGTKRQSQIQTFLDYNGGPGVQHLALKTDDIIETLTQIRSASGMGGFQLMERPSDQYYRNLPQKIGRTLTQQQYEDIERLGILADKDDQGVLLQIFTKPISDRPTIFLEIIQRIGCEEEVPGEDGTTRIEQSGGCGGFGKGNFSELFKSIEDYEKTIGI